MLKRQNGGSTYGLIARHLINLLKKGQFKWNDEAEDAFLKLKHAMTTSPILAMLNFNEPFTVETNAFGEGIGVVLTQQGRPIAFMSRALGVAKRSWSTYTKEMLAILQAVHTWRLYLLSKKFFVQTDQRSLKYFMEQHIGTPEQQNRVAKLLGYNYVIVYYLGRENLVVDVLSRVSGSPILNALFVPHVGLWEDIKSTTKDHPYMDRLCQLAHNNPGQPYSWRDGLVFYRTQVVVPPNTPLIH